jgi:hypothetical protein
VLVNDGTVAPIPGASTSDACEALAPGSLSGRIALVDRGACAFLVKAANVQAAGARAMLLANNANVAGGFVANIGGLDPTITIPTLGIGLTDATALKAALPANARAQLGSVAEREGTKGPNVLQNPQYAQLYAPTVFAGGSSVAHFDQRHAPNALMEPAITATLRGIENLDLTPALFQDTGWQLDNFNLGKCDTGGPNVNKIGEILSVKYERCAEGLPNAGQYLQCVVTTAGDDAAQKLVSIEQTIGIVRCGVQFLGILNGGN